MNRSPATNSNLSRSRAGLKSIGQYGFTLLELMVVLLILAMLATIAAPQVMKHLSKAKSETARIQVDALTASVNYFQLDTGRYPHRAGRTQGTRRATGQ